MKQCVIFFSLIILFFSFQAQGQIDTVFTSQEDLFIRSFCADINKDSIREHMLSLQNFGTRFYRAPGYRNVAQWIKNKFISVGCTNTVLDSFYIDVLPTWAGWQYNVIATITGTQKPDSVYVVGAHYDCTSENRLVNAPGADDNASGVAAAIEIARVMNKYKYKPKSTIKFTAFAAEEVPWNGLNGSDTLARRARQANMRIQMMLNNDMISYCADTVNNWKVMLTYYDNSPDVTNFADTCARRFTTLGTIRTTNYNDASDSYSFTQQGYKGIFFIESFDTPFYHTTNDRVETCNMKFAAEMTKISMSMLISQNGTETLVSDDEKDPVASDYKLYQNYPNPFNPSTTIRYAIPETDHVSIKIFNILGQEVRTLVNQAQHPGYYQVMWNGLDNKSKSVGSGVYVCKMQIGSVIKHNKMLLIK